MLNKIRRFLSKIRVYYLSILSNGRISKASYIDINAKIIGYVEVGFGSQINGPAYIEAREGQLVSIGRYCAIAHNLRIRSTNHNTNLPNMQYKLAEALSLSSVTKSNDSCTGVEIHNGVWIGDNVIILPGVIIGEGAVIGAGSIVTKDVFPYTIVAGNPASLIRRRVEKDSAERLLGIDVWGCSVKELKKKNYLTFLKEELSSSSIDKLISSLEEID
jgi:virginiamycin A acetyltransferase